MRPTASITTALAVFAAQLRDRPLRLVVSVAAIAVGIALAAAVHLINASALAEFGRATRELSGTADLAVRGTKAGFEESLYARLASRPGVRVASPVLLREAALVAGGTLPIEGVDPLLAAAIKEEMASNPDEEWQAKRNDSIASFLPKGKAGNWRNMFTQHDQQVFKEVAGDMLVKWAYEKDGNW